MRGTVTVLRHLAFEDLDSFELVLQDRGLRIRTIELDVDELSEAAVLGADLVVVLGGPISVNDTRRFPFIAEELTLLQRRLRDDAPCLGICLGAQLMSLALGGKVAAMSRKEIGFSPITIARQVAVDDPLRQLAGPAPVLHWHGEQFTIPEGATALASSELCETQAFRWQKNGLALQFHAEASATGMRRWLIGHIAELDAAGVDVASLRAESELHGPALVERGRAFFDAWLSRCGL